MQKKLYPTIIVLALLTTSIAAGLEPCWAIESIEQLNNEFNQQQVTRDNNIVLNIFKLIIILILIIASAWLVIKFFARQVSSRKQGNWLQVVDEIILGQNRGIIICKINRRVYALGVTDHQVNYLFAIDDPQFLDEIEQFDYQDLDSKHFWSDNFLSNNWLKKTEKYSATHEKKPQDDFHILIQEQLSRIHNLTKDDDSSQNNLRSDNNEKK